MEIPDVLLLEPSVFRDDRGFFMEVWHRQRFAERGIDCDFVQDNHSRSHRGTLRGIHYQIRQAQGKLVRVTVGEVFDVAVDLRKSSRTFGRWVGTYLSAESRQCLWIPPGFGHGFYVTSDAAELQYKCTDYYAREHERCIRWDDPDLSVSWPIQQSPLVSDKDRHASRFVEAECFP
jgi:dTDP-4-dehydrorhamnose 3,5-epimerase